MKSISVFMLSALAWMFLLPVSSFAQTKKIDPRPPLGLKWGQSIPQCKKVLIDKEFVISDQGGRLECSPEDYLFAELPVSSICFHSEAYLSIDGEGASKNLYNITYHSPRIKNLQKFIAIAKKVAAFIANTYSGKVLNNLITSASKHEDVDSFNTVFLLEGGDTSITITAQYSDYGPGYMYSVSYASISMRNAAEKRQAKSKPKRQQNSKDDL